MGPGIGSFNTLKDRTTFEVAIGKLASSAASVPTSSRNPGADMGLLQWKIKGPVAGIPERRKSSRQE
jgi:hypothetical protein